MLSEKSQTQKDKHYNFTYMLLLLSHFSRIRLCATLTLCDPIDGSPPGSPVPGILKARTLEWVAISFSNARKWKVKVKSLSRVRLLATPWTAAYQAPPSMGFSRQEYWSGVPLPSLEGFSTTPKSAAEWRNHPRTVEKDWTMDINMVRLLWWGPTLTAHNIFQN